MLMAAGLAENDKYIVWGDVTLGGIWRDDITAETEVRLRDDLGIFRNFTGAALTGHAFDRAIPGLGKWLVTIAAWLFAISTMISWSYYGEQGMIFLAGARSVLLYKLIFCALIIVATLPNFITTDAELSDLADLGTGCMLFANVPIIVIMAYQAMGAFRDYFGRMSRGDMEGPHAAPKITDVVEGKDVE
jgi:AGCS family alanine or glycine:cation symporter